MLGGNGLRPELEPSEDDYRIRRAVGAATSEGRVGGGEREARGASSVEGVGRCEIGGLLDVFEEASVAVGAGDGGGGDPDEAVAAVAPVRSRSHGDREEENVEERERMKGTVVVCLKQEGDRIGLHPTVQFVRSSYLPCNFFFLYTNC